MPLIRRTAPFVFIAILLLATGCGMSEEEARQKLADLNVEYSEENFVEHAAKGDRTVVDLFLKSGMNPEASAVQEALVGAVEGRHSKVARRIMEAGATLDANSDQAASLLVEAAASGNAELVQMLLEVGGDPNARADVRVSLDKMYPLLLSRHKATGRSSKNTYDVGTGKGGSLSKIRFR